MRFHLRFPSWLKQKRIDASLTATALAGKVGVTDRAIHQYESGERMPSLATSEKLAKELGVSLKYFAQRAKMEEPK